MENTFPLRPAENGISVDNLDKILGKKVNCDIPANEFIQFENIK